jgi:hypothetical protein
MPPVTVAVKPELGVGRKGDMRAGKPVKGECRRSGAPGQQHGQNRSNGQFEKLHAHFLPSSFFCDGRLGESKNYAISTLSIKLRNISLPERFKM